MPDTVIEDTATAAAPSKLQVFLNRLRSTVFLWALIGSALITSLEWLMIGMVGIFGFLTTIEYLRMDKEDADGRPFRSLAAALALTYWVIVLVQTLTRHAAPGLWLDVALPVAALLGAFCVTMRGGLEDSATLFRIFNTVFAIIYTACMFGFMARLLYFNGLPGGMNHMLLVIAITKFTDTGAYVVGSLFGRHKMIPLISPAKTWEGLVGAFAFGFLAVALVMFFGAEQLKPLTWGHALLLAPLLSLAAVIGDLAESVLKRCHHIKDAGHKLPGIGGILDLTDSLLFTAPVAYFYLQAIA